MLHPGERLKATFTDAAPPWGSQPIVLRQAQEFAARVSATLADQATIAKNLVAFSPQLQVRGVFFEGLGRIVKQSRGEAALVQIQRSAGVPAQVIAFRHYAHRDFYKFYYLAARVLHPSETFSRALRLTARNFFPIFRDSLLGKTMNALMGDKPRTILPLLAKAYNLSVVGNDHSSTLAGESEIAWACRVEPVEWYEQTFAGIIEGTVPQGETVALQVRMLSKALRAGAVDYRFQITW
jgi:uncharacterized protein (TIGR02265 family)